jgi:hypothetical protein
MWPRRKRRADLPKQLALGRLEEALGRVDAAQRRSEESEEEQPAAASPDRAAARIPTQRGIRQTARHALSFFRSSGEDPGHDDQHLTSA